MADIKVFKLNDYDWWAGETLEACVADWKEYTGLTDEELEDARELTAEEMERLQYVDPDESPQAKHSFAQELAERVAAGVPFPAPFATTEW